MATITLKKKEANCKPNVHFCNNEAEMDILNALELQKLGDINLLQN